MMKKKKKEKKTIFLNIVKETSDRQTDEEFFVPVLNVKRKNISNVYKMH